MSIENARELTEKIRKEIQYHENEQSFRCMSPKLEKVALAISAKFLKEYEIDKDERKLRKNFLAMRIRHLTRCLSLYNRDLQKSLTVDPKQISDILTIQFNQYVRLFENEITSLFGYLGLRKWKNKLMLSRYKIEGRKLVVRISQSIVS